MEEFMVKYSFYMLVEADDEDDASEKADTIVAAMEASDYREIVEQEDVSQHHLRK